VSAVCAEPLRDSTSARRRILRRLLAPVLCLGCLTLGGPFDRAPAGLPPVADPPAQRDAQWSGSPSSITGASRSPVLRGRVVLAEDAEVWKRLPAAMRGTGQRLPSWARALAATLPRTTAAMLELDYLHRAASPLDPGLRARLRWVAAHAIHCRYGEAYAEADLRRAGEDETAIHALTDGPRNLPAPVGAALAFADKLTRAADTVTDAEVARLIGEFGEEQVVAMVLLLAYANFQDRLVLALDLPVEAGGPLAPLDVRFQSAPLGARLAVPRAAPQPATAASPEREEDADWLALACPDLQKQMERQRARPPRIKLPPQEVEGALWGHVCRSYQPELAGAWAAVARAFDAEAEQDPVFEQSLFWVVTRSLQCFY
jgi:alkylhydroperoxidase family enzyme